MKDAARGNVSDVIFEQTAKRVKLAGLQPAVKLNDGKVDLTLNGIGPEDLGSLQFDAVLTQTVLRTGRFVVEALALLAVTAATQYELDFEGDVLDAIVGGFQSAGWASTEATNIAVRTSAEVHAGPARLASNAAPGVPKFGGLFGK